MGTMGVFVLIFWAISFFNSLKKKRAGRVFGWDESVFNYFVFNYFISGLVGCMLGCLISLGIGNTIPEKKWVLTDTEILEPVVIDGKQKFLIKKGVHRHFYFTKDLEEEKTPIVLKEILLEEKDIEYGGERSKNTFRKFFENKKLYWFFLCSGERTALILSSKDDIL